MMALFFFKRKRKMKSKNYKLMAIIFCSTIITLALGLPNMSFAGLLPDTGQTQSYTNTFGEDSDYSCNPHSYTDIGSDIVRDNVTGLEWVKDGNLMATHDPAFDADGTSGDGMVTWQHALDYVAKLNDDNYLEHSDWRLPTIKELSTLVDSSIPSPSPTINTSYFPDTVAFCSYWSSTASAYGTVDAWGVSFGYGFVGISSKGFYGCYVRAVRGGQAGSFDNLVINGDGTVTDTATGLMWQQATPLGTYTWEQALMYCENLTLPTGGYSDWRLPNRSELQSIVDYNRSEPAIDTTFFPNTVASYWSSTTNADSIDGAWGVYFDYGNVDNYVKSYGHSVRAVRGGQCGSTTTTAPAISPTFVPPIHGNLTYADCPGGHSHYSIVWTGKYGGVDIDRCEGSGGHPGVDITRNITITKESIFAIGKGTLIEKHLDITPGWGRYVVIRHDNVTYPNCNDCPKSVYSIYAHLYSIDPNLPEKDKAVESDQEIGIMGQTGMLGAVHLHLQIQPSWGGKPFWPKYTNRLGKPQSYPSSEGSGGWLDSFLTEKQRQEAAQNVSNNTINPMKLIESGNYAE
jgi:murein DD-endopeptidase MepM/ murein hydrolase activator NlpD